MSQPAWACPASLTPPSARMRHMLPSRAAGLAGGAAAPCLVAGFCSAERNHSSTWQAGGRQGKSHWVSQAGCRGLEAQQAPARQVGGRWGRHVHVCYGGAGEPGGSVARADTLGKPQLQAAVAKALLAARVTEVRHSQQDTKQAMQRAVQTGWLQQQQTSSAPSSKTCSRVEQHTLSPGGARAACIAT